MTSEEFNKSQVPVHVERTETNTVQSPNYSNYKQGDIFICVRKDKSGYFDGNNQFHMYTNLKLTKLLNNGN